MKVLLSRKVYLQLDDQHGCAPTACYCVESSEPDAACELCDGTGEVYEMPLSDEAAQDIEDNLRRQGVPLGKEGTH